MIKNIRHAAIVVRDLNKCLQFYEFFFELERVSDDIEAGSFIEQVVGLEDVKLQWVKLRTPNGVLIELLKYQSPESPHKPIEAQASHQIGHSHLAFTVDDIRLFNERLVSNGGSIVNPPALNPQGTAIVCYIHDPEGNILEIVQEVNSPN